jgi:outer membrane protein assembly factor BamB
MKYFLILILNLSTFIAFPQTSQEWNIFRGNPSLSGYSNARIKFPMNLKWTFQTDDAIVAGTVIGNNTIFVSSIGGIVYAIGFDGKLKWKFETDNSIEAPALYLNGKIYIGNLSGNLYALDAKTGKQVWKYETENQIMGSANFYYLNNKLYILVGSYDYYLHCVDGETGKNVWKYESNNFINGAPAIGNNMAMFGGCDGFLHMVNLETGKANNKLEVATYIAGSVTIKENLVFTGDYDGLFSCIDLNKKEIKWQFDNPSSNLPILGSPSVTDNKVVIGGQDKYLRSFDMDGNQIWSFNAGGRLDASPVIVKNVVIAVTMDGLLYALNLNNGKELWSYEVGSAMAHNPAVIDNTLVVGARDGNVYFFEK